MSVLFRVMQGHLCGALMLAIASLWSQNAYAQALSTAHKNLASTDAEASKEARADRDDAAPKEGINRPEHPAQSAPVTRLAKVIIHSTAQLSARSDALQTEGRYQLDKAALEALGNSSGSMTDALSTLPNVQYSDSGDTTTSLKPSSISIAGGRIYDNAIAINGIANTNMTDPASAGATSTYQTAPGHEQALFFDLDQLDEIHVYDSNVPVEYGNFTGGVVDASIKRPGAKAQTKLAAYSTEADWVRRHVIYDPAQLDNPTFTLPPSADFTRQRYTLSHERGLSATHAIRVGVSQQSLRTPMLSLLQAQPTEESSLNVALTHSYDNPGGLRALSYIAYAPYEKTTLIENVKDSWQQLEGGGISASSKLNFVVGEREQDVTLAVNQSQQSRYAPAEFYLWHNTASIAWGIDAGLPDSRAGGYGDLYREQIKASLNWKSQGHISDNWLLSYGVQLAHSEASFERPSDAIYYRNATLNTAIQCLEQSANCQQQEQYFRSRQIYPKDNVHVELIETAGFSALDYTTKQLLLSLGLRVDQDNFLENTNLAWRTRARWLIAPQHALTLVGGVNRYYGGPLLTYKLREAAQPYYQEYRGSLHNVITPWQREPTTGNYRYRFADVDTPYSDEFTLALRANWGPGVGEIKYLTRRNRDEFSRHTSAPQADGFQYYEMRNDGFSDYQSWVLGWDGRMGRFALGLNFTWSESHTSHDSYDDSLDAAISNERVWYRDAARPLSELTQVRTDFARPLVANLYLSGALGAGFTATVKGRYKGSHTRIVRGQGNTATGNSVVIDGVSYTELLNNYVDSDIPDSFLIDSKIVWQPQRNAALSFTAEIINLFDSRTHAINGFNSAGIEVGRSLWLGTDIKF